MKNSAKRGYRSIVRETYTDSEAVHEHMANLRDVFGQMLSFATLRLDVFGDSSQELIGAPRDLDITFYSYFQGL